MWAKRAFEAKPRDHHRGPLFVAERVATFYAATNGIQFRFRLGRIYVVDPTRTTRQRPR